MNTKRWLYVSLGAIIGIPAILLLMSITGGDGGAGGGQEGSASDTLITSTRFWVLWFLGLCVLIFWTVLNYIGSANTASENRFQSALPPSWAFTLFLGVTTFHWFFWATYPKVWSGWLQSDIFWPMNMALILAAFLIGQKSVAIKLIGIILGLFVVFNTNETFNDMPREKTPTSHPASTPIQTGQLPAEIVLPIIAECESGGRQFDESGNLIKNPGSTAIGKYQILASKHEKRAQEMGFDIRTLEGNEAYAKFLYQESGTLPWEADSASLACWGPKLLAIKGFSPAMLTTVWLLTIDRNWSEPVHVPVGLKILGERADVVAYEIQTQTGRVYQFPRQLGEKIVIPDRLTSLRFRVTDDDATVSTTTMLIRFKHI